MFLSKNKGDDEEEEEVVWSEGEPKSLAACLFGRDCNSRKSDEGEIPRGKKQIERFLSFVCVCIFCHKVKARTLHVCVSVRNNW